MEKKKVYLTLQNGKVFQGYRFGAEGEAVGEGTLELTEPSRILSILRTLLETGAQDALRLFAQLVGLLLVASVFGAIRRSLSMGGVSEAVGFCSTLAIFAAILSRFFASFVSFFYPTQQQILLSPNFANFILFYYS